MKQVVALITFLSVFLISFAVLSQTEKPEIVTDRPDQTEASVLVPQGGLQIESGFVYENDKSSNIRTTNYDYNTTLIKYGVNENFELRFITGYAGERIKISESTTSKINGFSPIAVGVKIKLAEERGFWPQAALISHVNLKAGSDEFESDYTSMNFRFTFAHTLSNKFALSYNVGAEWDGITPEATFLYTLALSYILTKKLGVFVETYSFFPEASKADNRIDGGFTYKFSPVVQWDISAGVGLSENAPDSFLSTGVSFRMFK